MTNKELCSAIGLPTELYEYIDTEIAHDDVLRALTDIETAPTAYEHVKACCGDDEHGHKMLACMLQTAVRFTYPKYLDLGIDDKIFFDTMSCFTRFCHEYYDRHDIYGFDRGWWTYRQLSCVLFEIGGLEYEYCDSVRKVQLHIPSGANIGREHCIASVRAFAEFCSKHFPERNYSIFCESWLLSPALDGLLPRDSKISAFKSMFDICEWDKIEKGFLFWVFGRIDIDYKDLPENTSLQRAIKSHLLNGGAIGEAKGRLKSL